MAAKGTVVVTDTDLGGVEIERSIIEAAGYELVQAECKTAADVAAAAQDAIALLVQFAPVTRDVFTAAPQLRALVRYGTGLDNIDLAAAEQAGVSVQGVVDYCTDEVADHTLALLLGVVRRIAEAPNDVRAGRWRPAGDYGDVLTLRGRRLGLLGLGRIGRAVAARALAFGMDVLAFDPAMSDAEPPAGVRLAASSDEVFGCDVVSLHLPLTPLTDGIVNERTLGLMPDGAILLNVSRGGLVNEDDLLAALDAGRPAWAALDVLRAEPPAPGHPLVEHPHVLVTPHLGFFSTHALPALRRIAAQNVVRLLSDAEVGEPALA